MYTSNTLPQIGFVRLSQILQLIPIGKSSWWAGVKSGKFPQPLKLGPRTTVWKAEDIMALINNQNQRLGSEQKD